MARYSVTMIITESPEKDLTVLFPSPHPLVKSTLGDLA